MLSEIKQVQNEIKEEINRCSDLQKILANIYHNTKRNTKLWESLMTCAICYANF